MVMKFLTATGTEVTLDLQRSQCDHCWAIEVSPSQQGRDGDQVVTWPNRVEILCLIVEWHDEEDCDLAKQLLRVKAKLSEVGCDLEDFESMERLSKGLDERSARNQDRELVAWREDWQSPQSFCLR